MNRTGIRDTSSIIMCIYLSISIYIYIYIYRHTFIISECHTPIVGKE